MLFKGDLLQLNRKHLGVLLMLMMISVICLAFRITNNDEFDFAKREILLRRVAHEILLQAGDSTSRVLPVKKISENEYRISFENSFSFQPESLVTTTQRVLTKDPLATDYVVNVLNCADATVAYGYAVAANKKDDIVACIGRKQPLACYMIDIKFKPAGIITKKNGYLLGGLTALAFVGFIFLRPVKRPKAAPETPQQPGIFYFGSLSFDTQTRKLMMNGTTVDLTGTETRVLRIFALSPNEVIERSRLQKEIWEDEGVIVGRSLDMFISKLRKKLELDPNLKIVVVRGKGYRLQTNA